MLPEGWRDALLDEVAKRGSGHTPSKSYPQYWDGGIKWVSLADSSRLDKGMIHETDKEISAAGIRNSSAVLHPSGTVVLSRDAGVGKSGILAVPMAVSQHFIAWDCSASKSIDNWYLYHWMQSQKPEFERVAFGSTIKTIGLPFFRGLRIPLPPVQEQRYISRILSTWDRAIAAAAALLDNGQRHKQALLERMLLTPAKHALWPLRRIAEVAERVKRRGAGSEELPVLMISSGVGFMRQDEKYSRYMAGKSVDNYIVLEAGEFAYNKGNSKRYEFGGVFPLRDQPRGLVPHVYVCFRLRDGFHASFFEHLFAADYLHDQLGALVNTGVRNNGLLNIRPDDFMSCHVPVPPLDEQQRIASVLHAATAWIERHEDLLSRLREEKAALMAQLLTGKRRVRVELEGMPSS